MTDDQEEVLATTIVEKCPRDVGLDAELWTLPLIVAYVEKDFGIHADPSTISRILKRKKITPQKPIRRAIQRDDEKCHQWITETFPEIVGEVEEQQATLLFSDETGVQEHGPVATTWGKRGKRPVVRASGKRRRTNVISAISPDGMLWFRCYNGNLNAALFITFLTALLQDVPGKIVLVLDSHPAHVAKITKEFIAKQSDRLTVYFLPGYAPDLNPDEHVWAYLKGKFRRKIGAMINDLATAVEDQMKLIQECQRLVKNFFLHPETIYVGESLAKILKDAG